MDVPFLDLRRQYEWIKPEIMDAIQEVLQQTAFAGGPFVEAFEDRFAEFCECGHAVGVGNGTDALWLALLACGVGPGDEVITVPNTFIATAEAISLCGARPVFIDIDPQTYTLRPDLIEPAVTAKTKAIVPVHLFGQMVDMDPVMSTARRCGLKVVEDAAQAHGAIYKGRPAGSIGDAGCFSFYPGKNLGAYGEAGAVVTSDDDIAGKIRMLRDHGQVRKYQHHLIGWNARMDGIQAAVLGVKLKYIENWNERRRRHACRYRQRLADIGDLVLPAEAPYGRHVFHIYAVRTRRREDFMQSLRGRGIACAMHYPVPVHLQEAYRFLGLAPGTCPVAEANARELVSLPMFPELDDGQIDFVASEIEEFFIQSDNSGTIRHSGKALRRSDRSSGG